jgi:ankyrin repeat protein
MDQIFNLIKSKDYKRLKDIIEKDTELNLNIFDDQNNYLIHYVLLNDQVDILKIILKRDIRLDILDIDGRTILHIPIKFNLISILKILLDYNSNLIGISIIDIKDKLGLTALHYCVILNNFECFKLLIKKNSDPLIRDNQGNNVLHLALKYNRSNMINYLIEIINLNFLSNNHETILQLALSYKNIELVNTLLKKKINLNNQEQEYGLGAIHQSILNKNVSVTDNIIKSGADINLQDYYGNTALMYAINENLINHVKLFLNYSYLNYNLTNFNGETALHLIFKNYDNYNEFKNIIIKLITNTDLNIQDNNGNTCLNLIIQNDLLKQYSEILETKELNIFIKDNNNISSYDFIKDSSEKIQIIVNSFYNYLQKNKDKLIIDWEIWCSTKENMELNKLDDSKCKNKIKEIITKENRSIPKLKDYDLILDNGIFVNTCFYTGAPIDILFGLLFLFNSFKNKGLHLIIDYPLTSNKELENYFKSLGVNYNYKLDFCNFEINWIYQKLIIPTYFDHEIKKKIKTNQYIVIPIGIETSIGAHANILFYDVKKSIIERFEPNGANPPKGFNYNPKLLDKLLEIKFKNIDNNIKLISPTEYLPIISFQILENINENECTRIGDPNGFCGVWCIWWIYHRMKNINIPSKELAEKLIREIKFKNLNFKTLIRNFSKNISDLRDNFLNKYKIDINDFIVENYDNSLLTNLEKDILKNI